MPDPPLSLTRTLTPRQLDALIALGSDFGSRVANMSSASTTTPAQPSFDERVGEVVSNKSEINSLILDYLTLEGYTKAAEKFSKEANLKPQQSSASIEARQAVKRHIHYGQIQDAIEALNDIDAEIIDKDPPLHFALLRLQLLELIRSYGDGGDIQPAIEFAQKQVAPKAVKDKTFLLDMEKTMALLLFQRDNLSDELAALLHPDQRRQVAEMVNRAMLAKQTQRTDTAIRQLVKMRAWSEQSLRDTKYAKMLPAKINLGLNDEDDDSADAGDGLMQENGSEPMVMT